MQSSFYVSLTTSHTFSFIIIDLFKLKFKKKKKINDKNTNDFNILKIDKRLLIHIW